MANLTIEGRAKTLPDIQRAWMWELLIPSISDVTGGLMADVEDLIIRTRTAVIPGRTIEAMTSEFMGMKQYFPGKTGFTGTFASTIEETQDQKVWKALSHWQNLIYLVDPTAPNGGASQRPSKRSVAKDIYLITYRYDGTPMEKKIRFYNCFPQGVGDVTLSYESAEQVKFEVTWQYDFWTAV
jgi:hypothetical protein